MNVMKEAHKAVREAFANVGHGIKLEYRPLFRAALIDLHKKAKAMQAQSPAELLKNDTIAKFEARIVELRSVLHSQDAYKFIVVCGDEHPMPINFEAKDPKWPWTNVEGATKWRSIQFARANASKVVNGNSQVGKAVMVAEHIEWDIANLQKLVKELKEGK